MNTKKKNHTFRFALLMAVFSALGPFSFDMYLPAFPQMMHDFDTDASMIQASLTACLLGLSAGQIAAGALSDVYGRRKPLIIALILFFLSSFGCAVAPNITVFIILRFIQGFAISAGAISGAIVRDLYSGTELTKFFSLLTMIRSLAPMLAPIAGGIVIYFTSWTGVFIILGVLGIFLTIISILRVKETLPADRRVPGNFTLLLKNFVSLLKSRAFMGYALSQGMMAAGIFAYVSGTPFVYQKIYGVSSQTFSFLFALNGISLILGAQLVKRLAGRMQERRILLMGLYMALMMSTMVLIVILMQGPLVALIIPLFFYVASHGITGPASFSLAMNAQGHIAGSAAALYGVIPFLLGSVTSPLVGIAGEYSAIPLGVIMFACSLLALLTYAVLVHKK